MITKIIWGKSGYININIAYWSNELLHIGISNIKAAKIQYRWKAVGTTTEAVLGTLPGVCGLIFVNKQKLYRCVVENKLKGKFGDGCILSEDAEGRGVTSWEGALAPSFTPLVHICLKSCIAVSQLEWLNRKMVPSLISLFIVFKLLVCIEIRKI